jgi:hypothetical protein
MQKNTLSELILTKFCHDIAGATGALMNGAELLADSFDDKEFLHQATNTLIDSSRFLTYRLRFFRAAFGVPKQSYTPTTAIQFATDYISTFNNIILDWENEGEEDSALTRIKLIACFVCISALTRGGKITVRQRSISASGQNAILPEHLELTLNGDDTQEENSETAAGLFLYNYAQEKDYKISVNKEINNITLNIE